MRCRYVGLGFVAALAFGASACHQTYETTPVAPGARTTGVYIGGGDVGVGGGGGGGATSTGNASAAAGPVGTTGATTPGLGATGANVTGTTGATTGAGVSGAPAGTTFGGFGNAGRPVDTSTTGFSPTGGVVTALSPSPSLAR